MCIPHQVLEWPSYSPDLNPCDYFLWGNLTQKLPLARDLIELRANVLKAWDKINRDPEAIRRTIEVEWPKRLREVIKRCIEPYLKASKKRKVAAVYDAVE